MNKDEHAVEVFNQGMNCAQSVLAAFSEDTGLKTPVLLRMGAAFGGGMARQQMTCGAVTGAYMVIGLLLDAQGKSLAEMKEEVRNLSLRFSNEFKLRHKTLLCRDLLGHDMNTDEGRMQIDMQDLYEKVCSGCVRDAVQIVEQVMKK